MDHSVRVPIAALGSARARPAFEERVAVLAQAYRTGAPPKPIPVCVTATGRLDLNREGNHRLAAARLSGVSHVLVTCDAEDIVKVEQIARRFA